MKKLTLVTLISAALSASAIAGDHQEKIDTTFADLDNDDNGYISREEADDNDIYAHFSNIDLDNDMRLSIKEFNTHVTNNPEHFDGDVVASVQSMKNSVEEVDPKTVSAAGDDHKMDAKMHAKTKAESGGKMIEKEVKVKKTVVAESEFDLMDTDNDGELTKAEASRGGVIQNFDDIDINGNELITRVEYSQYQRTMTENSEE
ncbi:calcium-binding protein [Alteromonas sp. H39]|uniref:calcium-binding protein n=1 Tax=Alteromonas sp. H39 TaxID=3389876 RepID=UPI0039E0F561